MSATVTERPASALTGLAAVRLSYTLALTARTPLHVGGAGSGGDVTADLVLARDGLGRLYLPGTTIAGVLRHTLTRLRDVDGEDVERLFGRRVQRARSAQGTDVWVESTTSLTTVTDAVVTPAGPVEVRTGVGIDRVTGAAAGRIRYDRQVIPASSTVTVELRYDGPDEANLTGLLDRLAGAIRHDGLRVGAGTRRGLGQLTCSAAHRRRVDLASRASLLACLDGTEDTVEIEPAADHSDELRIALGWRPARPVIVGSAVAAGGDALTPMTTLAGEPAEPVPTIPGSAVRGVLRSAAERIARTLCDPHAAWDTGFPGGADFVAASAALADRVPALGALFGTTQRAGALRVPDLVADTAPRPDAAPPVDVSPGDGAPPDGPAAAHLPGQAGPPDDGVPAWSRKRTHVALDRWTGGAASELLFTVEETQGVRWPPLRVTVDLVHLAAALPDTDGWSSADRCRAAVVLLGLALGQLVDATIGLGHSTARGLGEVDVHSFAIDSPGTGVPGAAFAGAPTTDAPPGEAGRRPVEAAWWEWLQQAVPDGEWTEALSAQDRSVR